MENIFIDINCPVCGGTRFKAVWRATPRQFLNDFRKSYYNIDALGIDYDTKFYIKKCKSCSFVFVNPQFRSDIYDVVYNEAKVEQHDKKQWQHQEGDLKHLYNTYHKWHAAKSLMKCISYFRKRFEKAKNDRQKRISLLDYVCGNGHILDLCGIFGIEAVGVDVDRSRIQFCMIKGLNVCHPDQLDKEKKFDIVISTSVVEHVHDLNHYFADISSRLKNGGLLHITRLSPTVIKRESKKGQYRLVMPFEHINYFTPRSLDILAKKYSLKRIKIAKLFQPISSPCDYVKPFLKHFVFAGFNPAGTFQADLVKA